MDPGPKCLQGIVADGDPCPPPQLRNGNRVPLSLLRSSWFAVKAFVGNCCIPGLVSCEPVRSVFSGRDRLPPFSLACLAPGRPLGGAPRTRPRAEARAHLTWKVDPSHVSYCNVKPHVLDFTEFCTLVSYVVGSNKANGGQAQKSCWAVAVECPCPLSSGNSH